MMQWTGTLLRNVACFRLRSGLAMWFVHWTLPLSLNYGGLICFLALLPRSFVLVRCLREANVAIFCGRFSWSRQTSLSKGFSYYFHDSTTELYFRSATRQRPCYSKTKTTNYSLRSWWYCVGARLKFWRRSRVPKKGSRDEAVEIPPARKPRYFE